jgi:hypothetical protein
MPERREMPQEQYCRQHRERGATAAVGADRSVEDVESVKFQATHPLHLSYVSHVSVRQQRCASLCYCMRRYALI